MRTKTDARSEFQSSELSRNPGEVFAAAEHGPVLVTRRDADSLVLMSARAADAQRELFEFAAQLIAITTDDNGTLEARMANYFPWMYALNEADRGRCAAEIVQAARAAFATENPLLAVTEVHAWRETAAAVAAGVSAEPVDWFTDDRVLRRP